MPQSNSTQLREQIGAVVLAGGRSSRMGFDKASLPFADSTFLEEVVQRIGSVVGRTIVVGNNRQQLTEFSFEHNSSVEVVFDEQDDSGPLEGIRVGLKSLASDFPFAFVSSCDVPLLNTALIPFLFEQMGTHEAVVPFDPESDRVFGMTAIYRTELHERIAGLIQEKRLRVSELSKAFKCQLVPLADLRQIDPELKSLLNINRLEDYRELLENESLPVPKKFQ